MGRRKRKGCSKLTGDEGLWASVKDRTWLERVDGVFSVCLYCNVARQNKSSTPGQRVRARRPPRSQR